MQWSFLMQHDCGELLQLKAPFGSWKHWSFCRKCNVSQEMANDRNSGQVDILHSLVVKIRLGNYCRWRVMISGSLACEQPFAGTPNSEGVSLLTRIMYYSRGVLEWKRRVQKAEVLCLFLAVLRWDYLYRCETGNVRYLERVLYDIMFVDRIYIYIVGCSRVADCHLFCLKEKSTLRPRGVFRQIIGAIRGGKTNHCHMVARIMLFINVYYCFVVSWIASSGWNVFVSCESSPLSRMVFLSRMYIALEYYRQECLLTFHHWFRSSIVASPRNRWFVLVSCKHANIICAFWEGCS